MNRKTSPATGQDSGDPSGSDLYQYIGAKIRAYREQATWSQERLANEMNVTSNTISRWETATYRPSAADLDRLARIFQIAIWAFFPPSVKAPTEALGALLSATGDLPPEDLEELQRYADFIRAGKALGAKGVKQEGRRGRSRRQR